MVENNPFDEEKFRVSEENKRAFFALTKIDKAADEIVESIKRITKNERVSSYIDNLLSKLDAPNSKLGLVIVSKLGLVIVFIWNTIFSLKFWQILFTHRQDIKTLIKLTYDDAYKSAYARDIVKQQIIKNFIEFAKQHKGSIDTILKGINSQVLEKLIDNNNILKVLKGLVTEGLINAIKSAISTVIQNLDGDNISEILTLFKDGEFKLERLTEKEKIQALVTFAKQHKGSIDTILKGIDSQVLEKLINNNISEGLVTEELINTIKTAIPNVIENLDGENISEILTLFKDGEFKLERLTEKNLTYITSIVKGILKNNQETISQYLATNDFIKKRMEDIIPGEINAKAFTNIIDIINGLLDEGDDLHKILQDFIKYKNSLKNRQKVLLISRILSLIKKIHNEINLDKKLDINVLKPLINYIALERHYTDKELDTQKIQELIQNISNDTNISDKEKISELKKKILAQNLYDNQSLLKIIGDHEIQSFRTKNYALTKIGKYLQFFQNPITSVSQCIISRNLISNDTILANTQEDLITGNLDSLKEKILIFLKKLEEKDITLIAKTITYEDFKQEAVMQLLERLTEVEGERSGWFMNAAMKATNVGLKLCGYIINLDEPYKKVYNKICEARMYDEIINVNKQLDQQDLQIFHGKILDRYDFNKCHFIGFNFSETSLNNTDFKGAKFINCNFDNAKLNETNFDNASFDEESFKSLINNISQENIESLHTKIIINQNEHNLDDQHKLEMFINPIIRKDLLILHKELELCTRDPKKSLSFMYNYNYQSYKIDNSSNYNGFRDFESLALLPFALEDKFKQKSDILTNYSHTTSMSSITFSSHQNIDIDVNNDLISTQNDYWRTFVQAQESVQKQERKTKEEDIVSTIFFH